MPHLTLIGSLTSPYVRKIRILLAEKNPEIMLIRPAFDEEFYGVAVRKGDTNLLETVNQTLAAVSADGRYDQWVGQWLVGSADPRE